MKLGKRYGIVAAMESLENVAPETDDTLVLDEDESAGAVVAETNESVNDIEDHTAAIDDATEASDDLADIADTVEQSGELDETSAAITEVAVESLYRRLGITRKKAMPAMEAFGSVSNRKKSTKLAVEGFKESLKTAWAAIKKFIIDLWNKIVAFFKGLFDSVLKLEKKAQAVKDKASKSDASIISGGHKIKAGSWVTSLMNKDGNFDGSANPVNRIHTELGESIDLINELEASAKALSELKPEATKETYTKILDELGYNTPNYKQIKDSKVPAESGMFLTGPDEPLPDGNRLIIAVSVDTETTDIAKCYLVKTVEPKVKSGDEVPGLFPKDVVAVADSVLKVVKFIKESQKRISGIEKLSNVVKSKDSVMDRITDKEGARDFHAVVKRVQNCVKVYSMPVILLNKVAVNTCGASLNYCAASFGGWQDTKPTEAPAKA